MYTTYLTNHHAHVPPPITIQVWYTVDIAPADWTYSVGFINEAMLSDRFPKASRDVGVLICGPPPMINFAVKPALNSMGYVEDQFFIF